jgi:hypothetical protein
VDPFIGPREGHQGGGKGGGGEVMASGVMEIQWSSEMGSSTRRFKARFERGNNQGIKEGRGLCASERKRAMAARWCAAGTVVALVAGGGGDFGWARVGWMARWAEASGGDGFWG